LLLLGVGQVTASDRLVEGADLLHQGKDEQAFELYLSSAKLGDPVGAFAVGVLYFTGQGVARDLSESTRWFRFAAEKNYAPAQFNLGNAYLHGRGVSQDTAVAAQWWRKAAYSGYAPAQFNLGSLLYNNPKTAEQRELGIAWFRAAAERGFAMAMKKLDEIGEPKDFAALKADPARQPQRDEARLLTLDPRGYTIQVLSALLPTSAEHLISENQLEGQALRFRFPGKQGIWTGLAYGWYPSRADATASLERLNPALQRAGPWIRTVESVQVDIRKAR
jgi:hypothetical protein